MKRVTAEELEKRWKVLLEKKLPPQSAATTQQQELRTDPFDCSNMAVPPSQVVVDGILAPYIQQWKHLEERRVVSKDFLDQKCNEQQDDEPTQKRPRLLPFGFDCATRESKPPEDSGQGDRVLSLQNPSLHLSFEAELWQLFQSVPNHEEIEAQLLANAKCTHMKRLHQEITEALQSYTRLDGHGLARMRMRDRHDLPQQLSTSTTAGDPVTTIRLECWRRHLRRGSSPDPFRMELEFLGTQTLKDVHDAIVELARDELWQNAQEYSGGVFFIENCFYTVGSVDYAGPIQRWLDGTPEEDEDRPPRRIYLGLSSDAAAVASMQDTRLDQLRWRLGVRYYHCHHGDVECALFLTDVRQGPRSNISKYPIVHDVWASSYPVPECDACRRKSAALVSSASNRRTDGGPRALCQSCYEQLHSPSDEKCRLDEDVIKKYSVWRDQVDLSVGCGLPDAKFES